MERGGGRGGGGGENIGSTDGNGLVSHVCVGQSGEDDYPTG